MTIFQIWTENVQNELKHFLLICSHTHYPLCHWPIPLKHFLMLESEEITDISGVAKDPADDLMRLPLVQDGKNTA